MNTLTFWFDYVSPYAFLAWQQLPALALRHQLQLKPVPVVLGGLLKAHQLKGPAEVPVKRAWVYTDALRIAAIEGVMMQFPPTHPFRSLTALRATYKVSREAPEKLEQVVSDLFAAGWQAGHDLSNWKTIAGVLANHGLSYTEESVLADDIKSGLRELTEAAQLAGVFGVPSFGLGDQLFWGQDRLGQLDYLLTHGDPLDPGLVAEALATPAGA